MIPPQLSWDARAEGDGWIASCPELEVWGKGSTLEEALATLEYVVWVYLENNAVELPPMPPQKPKQFAQQIRDV